MPGGPAAVPALPAAGEPRERRHPAVAVPGAHRSPPGSIPVLPQGCPSGSVPFRAMQCSLYDNRPVLGASARYRWVPFHGGERAPGRP